MEKRIRMHLICGHLVINFSCCIRQVSIKYRVDIGLLHNLKDEPSPASRGRVFSRVLRFYQLMSEQGSK